MDMIGLTASERVAELKRECEALDRAFGQTGQQVTPWEEVERRLEENDQWWATLEPSLDWKPIATYERPSTGKGRLAMFRSTEWSDFGAWIDGVWTRVCGFGNTPIEFEPAEWAILPPDIEQDFVES